jgi:hypothetical protein
LSSSVRRHTARILDRHSSSVMGSSCGLLVRFAPARARDYLSRETIMSLKVAVAHLARGDWEKAHAIVQDDESALGCWAHGIVHLLEGDMGNAAYWYRRAGRRFPEKVDVTSEVAALAAACGS